MKLISNVCYGKTKHPEQYLDIYLPDKDAFKVFVYMHGGGIEAGDKSSMTAVGEYVASQGIALFQLIIECIHRLCIRSLFVMQLKLLGGYIKILNHTEIVKEFILEEVVQALIFL